MEAIIIAVTPVIVNILMKYVKMIPEFSEMQEGNRKTALRFSAYGLSFVSIYLTQYISDGLDMTMIQTMLTSLVPFLMSQGLYHLKQSTQK